MTCEFIREPIGCQILIWWLPLSWPQTRRVFLIKKCWFKLLQYAVMMRHPVLKCLWDLRWNWADFSSIPEKVTHRRCKEMQHAWQRKRTQGSWVGRAVTIVIIVGGLWSNMKRAFSKCIWPRSPRMHWIALMSETALQLLWLHSPNVFCLMIIDDYHQSISMIAE